ncbi:NHL repeat containing protein [Pirellula staleyi DSM 6068]|uniref:NHL repeat containing protein n=1 Tax=Pirellula staleyi (strain ATCC 27377 / DSM 6068 / ICPB 4128) TaxID=530564 RepID=D2R2P6_PIRSD|nr:NHL repeat containing protein [Pirellula staleyi DSM 6068]
MVKVTSLVLVLLGCLTLALTLEAGTIDTVAGTGKPADGPASGLGVETNVGDPFGVEIGPDGALYITEVRNHRVRRLDLKTGAMTTVAGSGKMGYAGDGGPATEALLNEPYEVRFDSHGNMIFVEMKNFVIRKVDAKTGIISTIAGSGKEGFAGDGGPAKEAVFSIPHSIALDADDNIYVCDLGNHRIRKIDAKTGLISTIAGNGGKTLPKEGKIDGTMSLLGPRAVCIDKNVMWIALREGHSVWKLNLATSELTHIAGTGKKGFSGDGGPAKDATFDGPKGVAVCPDGGVVVVDTENHVIRKIDVKAGTISTVPGHTPKKAGGDGDGGDATKATMNRPHGICVDKDGSIYIGDTLNHRVRRVRE